MMKKPHVMKSIQPADGDVWICIPAEEKHCVVFADTIPELIEEYGAMVEEARIYGKAQY